MSNRKPKDQRANPQRHSGFVWLASYPKSGNTWIRAFLHNLLCAMSGAGGTPSIGGVTRFGASVNTRALYAKILGFMPSDEHLGEIAAARHEVQRFVVDQLKGLIFSKTHEALTIDRGFTTINLEVTAGAIYVMRNPLDVAISYAHHLGLSIDKTIESMGTANAEMPLSKQQIHQVLGSWSQHVASWTREPHQAIHVMRYEDMLADPERSFGGLARHLLMTPTQAQLAQAIDQSSFENLRAQEEAEGFRERPEAAERFFREGRAGQWKEVLTPEQVDRIVKDHGEQMARFGYLPN